MKIAALLLSVAMIALPSAAVARGGHHGLFGGGGHHGHSINAWMGSHRPRLR